MKFEDAPDDDIKNEIDLQKKLLSGLPETDIAITYEDIVSIIDINPSENIKPYWDKLTYEQKATLTARAEKLYRPAK